jgi:hypothetical protein
MNDLQNIPLKKRGVVTLNGYEKQINDIKNIPLIDNHYQIDN